MPSNKKSKSAADTPDEVSAAASAVSEPDTADDGVQRVDLLDSLEVGEPGLPPVPCTLGGIDFAINRYYSPATIVKWCDIQRQDIEITDNMTASQRLEVARRIEKGNREVLRIIVAEEDHDKIEDILTVIGDRSVPEARRIFAFMNIQAGLTDKWGNPLAL